MNETFETRGVVVLEPNVAPVQEFRSRGPQAGEVLIRTAFSGISTGTDRWVLQGRFAWESCEFPFVPGYQRCGEVVALGEGVVDFHLGQQVVATTSVGFVGPSASWGAHVAEAVSPVDEVYDATGVDPAAASLFISGQVGVNAAGRIRAEAGSRVVVIGDGIIGASAALAARSRGFDVMIVGRHPSRLDPVAQFGVQTLNSRTDDLSQIGAFAPHAAIDTIQSDESFAAYVDALPRRFGEVVFSGHSPDGATHWADMTELQKHELTAHFVSGWESDRIHRTLDLMRTGELPLAQLIGARATGIDEIDREIADVIAGPIPAVSVVLDWRTS